MLEALELRMTAKLDAVHSELHDEITEASKFQDGARGLAKGLAWVLGVLALVATIYGSAFR